ncbi:MAG: hypothetical protein ONB07_01655 [candidate division KSB1 bacterium]|nr:hypothetical protein [candidate division KSB1 bacterium]MDZ7392365.1 hypothetical protein [candidate division KSB1 bacterium]MDZ7412121.1 hypothetical protein [candidate division KSB1 bacterium]
MDPGLWQKEKELVSELLVRRIVGQEERESFTYDELLRKPLPDFLRMHIKSQARRFLREEKPMSWNSSTRYKFDDPEIREAVERLLGLLLLKTRFSSTEIKRWIELGVSFQVDMLVRPREALVGLFYRRQQVRRKDEVVHTLQQLADGRPYLTTLTQLISTGPEEVDAAMFEVVARQAEEQTYGTKPLSSFMGDVSKLMSFFQFAGHTNGEVLRTEQLLSMLHARNLSDIAGAVRELAAARGTTHWTLEQIETTLERQLLLRGLCEEDNGGEDKACTLREGDGDGQRGPRQEQLLQEAIYDIRTAMGGVSLLENLFAPPAPVRPKREVTPRRITAPRLTFAGVDEDETPRVIHRSDIERQPPGPYPSLRSLIGNKERKMFIKKLFDNDRGAYHAFIDKLEGIERWKEAKAIIDQELARRQISPFCREAARLGDLVFSRYFAKRP